MKSTAIRLGLAMTACAVLVSAMTTACSGSKPGNDSGTAPPKIEPLGSVGNGEGQLNLIAWAGYAENGSNDPKVDWVTPFEKASGCKVNVKVGNTSDEMVQLMRTGQYDGVSASGDATLRLIYAGDVAPVNTSLVPNYASISSFLKDKPWNSVDGQMYGIPHGWGANLLMYEDETRTGDQGSVLVDLGAARRRGATAQGAEGERQRVLVGLHQGGAGLRIRHRGHRHDVAGDRQHHRHRQQGPGQHRDPEGGLHRLV
jgi:putative spermidine/putrescine transport system substrate-binding protein